MVTVTDTNDETPTYTAGDTTPSVAEGATAVDSAVAITDTDALDANVCTLGGADAAKFTCTLTGQTAYSLAFTNAPDFETDTSTDQDGDYDVTVTINDGDNDGATITYVVTVTDTNDQAPTYTAGDTTPSVAEGATAVDSAVAITDTDSGDANVCTLAGFDAALFTCTLTDQTAYSLAFTDAPDFEAHADTGADGDYDVTVTINDGVNDGATITYVVSVTNVNEAPTVSSVISDASAAEDSAYSTDISGNFADVDGDTLTYTATGMPSTLTMSSAGTLSGTPVSANVGTHSIVVTASDGTLTVADTFVLTVTDVNDGPAFSSTGTTSATEDTAYAYIAITTDEESQAITLTGTTIPAWANFVDVGTGSGVLSGTPENGDVGTHNVVITATDASSASTSQSFTITVTNVNDAPTLSSAISDASMLKMLLTAWM